jgi:hypothetical protein
MRVHHGFDLGRVHILSEPDDHFLGSAHDEKISVFEPSKIAGVEPSFRIDCCSCIFQVYLSSPRNKLEGKVIRACRRRLLKDPRGGIQVLTVLMNPYLQIS